LREIFDPKQLYRVANSIAKKINKDKKTMKIKSIAVVGVSGISLGGIVSYLTKLPLIVVRKEKEEHHGGYNVEYTDYLCGGNYCIVDDLIDSGKTIDNIIEKMKDREDGFTLVKIYLYHPLDRTPKKEYNHIPIFRCRMSR